MPEQDSFVPLLAAAGAFLAVLLWRVRPAIFSARRRVPREVWREAQARIDAASDDAARAAALSDAADLAVRTMSGRGRAAALYLRAFRSDPTSSQLVERAVAALSRRPHTLEALLWRRLANAEWRGTRDATGAALAALQRLYEGPLRNGVRARAVKNARAALRDPLEESLDEGA